MALPRLEIFDDAATMTEEAAPPALDQDDDRLALFEQGYSAGWEDAAKAHASDQARISADLARSLQAMGLTLEEARAHVLATLAPLLLEVTRNLLPAMARHALPQMIREELGPPAEELAAQPAAVTVNPADRAAVEAVLERAMPGGLRLVEEPTLAEGQAYLRRGPQELHVDLAGATAEIGAAIRTFFEAAQGSA